MDNCQRVDFEGRISVVWLVFRLIDKSTVLVILNDMVMICDYCGCLVSVALIRTTPPMSWLDKTTVKVMIRTYRYDLG